MTESRPVRVRFAPSPTGDMHIGGVRTAMFNWLFARRHGGKFILRIEDTDQERFKEGSLDGILEGLKWVGLEWDEGPDVGGPYGPYIQSQRVELYQQWAQWLLDHDKAYKAYETPDELELIDKTLQRTGKRGYDRRGRHLSDADRARYEAEGRKPVVRFKIPLEGDTVVNDLVRGPISVKNEQLADLVLLKSDGFPTYHLANVVDDHFMEISHILRAEEWISTAPIHKLLYDAFGWEMPQIAHVPVILKQSGKGKMSKRDEGAAISYFINGGYIPEAVVNYLCNVGWSYNQFDAEGKEIQIFSKEDAAKVFDVTRVTPTGTKFDLVKLNWLNGEYIRRMEPIKLAKYLRPYLQEAGYEVNVDVLIKLIPIVRERLKTLKDIVQVAGFMFKETITVDNPELLIPKKATAEQTLQVLQIAHDLLAGLPEFTVHAMEEALRPQAEKLGLNAGQFFSPIRAAVTGQTVSPPLFETLEIIGREVTLERLKNAIALMETQQVK
ncbi:MAG: glutamate--tRNA ligase [Anaerolineae bacterium]|nr:glutamate--tRNA ligase [Anaerolineae bacterium]